MYFASRFLIFHKSEGPVGRIDSGLAGEGTVCSEMYTDVETSNWIECARKPRAHLFGWGQMTGSSRLHDLIRICQHTIPNLPEIRWNRRLPTGKGKPGTELHRGRSSFRRCAAVDSGFRPWHPLEASKWVRIGEHTTGRTMPLLTRSVKSSQLCGDANYSRVHAEEGSLARTTTLHGARSTLPLSPRYIAEGWNGITRILDWRAPSARPMFAP